MKTPGINRFLLLIGLIFNAILPVNAGQYYFSAYSIEDGLSQSVVNCIFQDSRGYIWLGTQNGLNKFNGYVFTVYTHDPSDLNSIPNNWIFSITEDKFSDLWIGTKNGLVKYDRSEDRFISVEYQTPFGRQITRYVYDVKCSRDGHILINTPPVLSVCDPASNTFLHFKSTLPIDESVKDFNIPLLESKDGRIWVGSSTGLSVFNPATSDFTIFLANSETGSGPTHHDISALYEDKSGNIWVGSRNGLSLMPLDSYSFKHFFAESAPSKTLSNNFIRAITEDKSGNIWIATEGGGINRLRFRQNEMVNSEKFDDSNSALNHNICLSLFIDNSNNLWIGTLSGVNKTDLKPRSFNLIRKSDSPNSVNLSGNVIASVYRESSELIWIGTWGQGLNLYNRKTGELKVYRAASSGKYHIPDDYVHTIFEDNKHDIWLGTRDGIVIFNKKLHNFLRPSQYFKGEALPGFEGVRINMMIQDRNGAYWFATNEGVYKLDRKRNKVLHYQTNAEPLYRISANLVYAILEDSEGLIWIGTINGLDLIKPDKEEIIHFSKEKNGLNTLSDNFITALCEDRHGDLWIGTHSHLNRYSKKRKEFSYYGIKEGFPGNLVYSILKDQNESLWFATSNGLCRFDEANNNFVKYQTEDGLQGREFNLRASFLSEDGEMFFGGMNGLNSFYPDSIKENPFVPVVAFTSAYKIAKGSNLYFNLENIPQIHVYYGENTFTVEFAAMEFTNPSKNSFAYMLEGADKDWIYIGTRNFVTFSNLPPGSYTLWVKGSNNDGHWSEKAISIPVIVHPPWWWSNAAIIAYALLAIAGILIFVRIRERSLVRGKKLLEEKVELRTILIEKQKSEILRKNADLNDLNNAKDKFFSIIAHDLRNPFNTIIGMTDILLITLNNIDPAKLEKTLQNIKTSSQQAYQLLENLLLWARSQTGAISFKPADVNINTLVVENIGMASVQAARKNIQIISQFNTEKTIIGDANMVNTILRNLLTNAIKFTPHDGKIHIETSSEYENFILEVKDNGIGMTAEKVNSLFNIDSGRKTKGTDQEPGTGLGLILCKELAEKHGGRIEVKSIEKKGSTFRVYFPLTSSTP